jgi:hypothetical protein
MNANELADELERPILEKPKCLHFGRTKEYMEKVIAMLRQQQAEIEALTELNTMLKDAIEKRIGMDAERYKWLRTEFAAGRETYLAEGIPSGETLDKYIDGKLNK